MSTVKAWCCHLQKSFWVFSYASDHNYPFWIRMFLISMVALHKVTFEHQVVSSGRKAFGGQIWMEDVEAFSRFQVIILCGKFLRYTRLPCLGGRDYIFKSFFVKAYEYMLCSRQCWERKKINLNGQILSQLWLISSTFFLKTKQVLSVQGR